MSADAAIRAVIAEMVVERRTITALISVSGHAACSPDAGDRYVRMRAKNAAGDPVGPNALRPAAGHAVGAAQARVPAAMVTTNTVPQIALLNVPPMSPEL